MNVRPCSKCGMPGAVLHFPGGYLCRGGCKSTIQEIVEQIIPSRDQPQTRIAELERELSDCNRMLDETRAMLPTMAQTMVYGSLLRKFKKSQAQLADCQKRLEEARWLVSNVYCPTGPNWYSRRNAFLATFKDNK